MAALLLEFERFIDDTIERQKISDTEAMKTPSRMESVLTDAYLAIIPAFALLTWNSLTQSAVLLDFVALANTYISQNVRRIAQTIDGYTREIMQSIFESGSTDVKGDFMQTAETRAVRIAETETVSASNAGVHVGGDAYDQISIDTLEKVWVSVLDNRVRDAHRTANGQVKISTDPFEVWGEKLMFPGDRSLGASARNVINCRCTIKYRKKDELN